jgi:hypothetical protein
LNRSRDWRSRRILLVEKSHYRETDEAVAVLVETRIKTAAEYERTLLDDSQRRSRRLRD